MLMFVARPNQYSPQGSQAQSNTCSVRSLTNILVVLFGSLVDDFLSCIVWFKSHLKSAFFGMIKDNFYL